MVKPTLYVPDHPIRMGRPPQTNQDLSKRVGSQTHTLCPGPLNPRGNPHFMSRTTQSVWDIHHKPAKTSQNAWEVKPTLYVPDPSIREVKPTLDVPDHPIRVGHPPQTNQDLSKRVRGLLNPVLPAILSQSYLVFPPRPRLCPQLGSISSVRTFEQPRFSRGNSLFL